MSNTHVITGGDGVWEGDVSWVHDKRIGSCIRGKEVGTREGHGGGAWLPRNPLDDFGAIQSEVCVYLEIGYAGLRSSN